MFFAMLLALTAATSSRAQSAPVAGSPEAVLGQALAAMNQDRIEEYTAEMHPDALKQFRAGLTAALEAADKEGKAGEILPLFKGAKSVDDLKQRDDRQFFAGFLRGMMGLNPQLKKILAEAKTEMLGHVDEGKDVAHVVYKLTVKPEAEPIETITVNSLQKLDSKWMLALSGDMEGMVVLMKQKAAGVRILPDLTRTRVEPAGRLITGNNAGPAYVVYRMITPIGDSQLSKIGVITVQKSDPNWAVAERGKPEELATLIRAELRMGPPSVKEPSTDVRPKP
jgi:hypothetical protein